HRHGLRDPAGRAPGHRFDLLRWPLRGPGQPLHQVETAGRGHLNRPDPAVLAAARGWPDRGHRREQRPGHGRADGREPAGRRPGHRPPPAPGWHQHRSADGAAQDRQAVPVRLACRHPFRGAGRPGRAGAWRGRGQGPGARAAVRRAARRTGRDPEGRTGTGPRPGRPLIHPPGPRSRGPVLPAPGTPAPSVPHNATGRRMTTIRLDGQSLTRDQLVAVAQGAKVALDPGALEAVSRAADFLAEQVRREEPIYGVSTGFGSNADKLLGAHPLRDELPGAAPSRRSLHEELQRNLIVTHAVCVGEPMAADVVRAMLCIRINTLLKGHSGIRVQTLEALAALLNAGIVPVVPQLGSVGASGDLAPLSHLAIVLLGGGEAFLEGQRMPGAEALRRAGLESGSLSYKEGLALNNGTAQMLAMGVLALHRLEPILDPADLAAAMNIDAIAGRLGAFAEEVHALRPHPGQVRVAANLRRLLSGSTLADIPYHLVPRFRPWLPSSWDTAESRELRFDIGWDWVPADQRHGREKFYQRFLPFRGGKKHQPQDSYSLRCIPQVHGAVRDAAAQAARVLEVELNAVTDNPLVFPD